MVTSFWAWSGFIALILLLLALDLGVLNRKAHAISPREAAITSLIWVSIAGIFNLFVYAWRGPEPALEFLTGYLIELSLSLDNIFIFVMIFGYFSVPSQYQHRVLFWGILGAIVLRLVMILVGIKLVESFHWILYAFGAFLIYSGIEMLRKDHHSELGENRLLKLFDRFLPMTGEYVGQRFFIRLEGKLFITPLFPVLVSMELSDLMFAVDSIPAIFAITLDPFIVFSSNIFAILGLRSFYFLLADLLPRFYYLRHALCVVLSFVGIKMLLLDIFKIPTLASLLFILLTFLGAIGASLLRREK